jgi:hypothetical protein
MDITGYAIAAGLAVVLVRTLSAARRNRKFGRLTKAADNRVLIHAINAHGHPVELMFTNNEILRAMEKAAKFEPTTGSKHAPPH